MKNKYIILLSSLLFALGWFGSRYYQIKTNEVEFNKRIPPSYKGVIGSKEEITIPIWEQFTKEEKENGVFEYKIRK
tara:strand:- start:164 stop:391 length:228 start_codon:yes stop_codon:yes gene_type:complete